LDTWARFGGKKVEKTVVSIKEGGAKTREERPGLGLHNPVKHGCELTWMWESAKKEGSKAEKRKQASRGCPLSFWKKSGGGRYRYTGAVPRWGKGIPSIYFDIVRNQKQSVLPLI